MSTGYTHQKKPYQAKCVQWDGNNVNAIRQLVMMDVVQHGASYLAIRHENTISTISPGWWVVKGENGQVKCYSDEAFRVKYQDIK